MNVKLKGCSVIVTLLFLMYMVYICALETVPVFISDLIVYLTVASVAAELSEEVTGASAVLTSAV